MRTAPFKRPPTLFRVTRHLVLKNQGYTKTPTSAMLEMMPSFAWFGPEGGGPVGGA